MTRPLPVTALLIMLLLLLCGCLPTAPPRSAVNRHIDVFGLTLFARTDLHRLRGITAETEPCLHGSEYRFEALDLAVGVDHAGTIRRLVSRNPATSLFGIHIGDGAPAARQRLREAGFVAAGRDRFQLGWAQVTLLIDESERVFGLAIETLE